MNKIEGLPSQAGRYIYGIINSGKSQNFGPLGIGGRADIVHTLGFRDIAAVISNSPIVKYPVTRENSITHQRVLEKVMEKFTVLPARFCTIAEHESDIKEKVLKPRYKEFKNLLEEMNNKAELGVRAIWTNMEEIFRELVEENKHIKQLKEKIAKEVSAGKVYAGKIKIGEMVQTALEEKKEKEAKELLAVLKPLSVDFRENKVYGDRNIANFAFLVEKVNEKNFDEKIEELVKKYKPRKEIKYIGPVPPYNFVEVIITW